MTTPAQHLVGYDMNVELAARFRKVAASLEAAGDQPTADLLESYATGYDLRAGDAILAAAAEVRLERDCATIAGRRS